MMSEGGEMKDTRHWLCKLGEHDWIYGVDPKKRVCGRCQAVQIYCAQFDGVMFNVLGWYYRSQPNRITTCKVCMGKKVIVDKNGDFAKCECDNGKQWDI
jgi:hypothetical protein